MGTFLCLLFCFFFNFWGLFLVHELAKNRPRIQPSLIEINKEGAGRAKTWGQFLGPDSVQFFGSWVAFFILFLCPQLTLGEVLAWLQWAKAVGQVDGKTPLFVNMDETSVSYSFASKVLGLRVSKAALPPGKKRRKQKVAHADNRAHISFLAFLTHLTDVQPKLPQIFLASEKLVPKKLLQELSPHIPENYHFITGKSSWNSHAMMRKAICLLAKSLAPYMATHQVILILDVARCHYHQTISVLATSKGIRLLYVPGKLTWLLQPADTHCFSRLKALLRKKWVELRSQSSTGMISHKEWLCAVMSLVPPLLNGVKWESAFKAAGLLNAKLSSRVMGHLGWEDQKQVPNALPCAEQLKVIFPGRTSLNTALLFKWSVPKAKAKAAGKAKAKAKAKAMAVAAHDAPMLS